MLYILFYIVIVLIGVCGTMITKKIAPEQVIGYVINMVLALLILATVFTLNNVW